MKKLITLVVVAFFATATFAQDKMDSKPAAAKSETKMHHECYMMKDGALMHCTGDKADAQKTAVTLKNGTTVSPSGEVKMKDGKTTKLENGQCISMMGGIGDCEKMHASLKENKMQEQKTK
jgi:hypothetical protein